MNSSRSSEQRTSARAMAKSMEAAPRVPHTGVGSQRFIRRTRPRSAEPKAKLPNKTLPLVQVPAFRMADRIIDIRSGPLQVRLAESGADIDAAQALRYKIFYEKLGAQPLPELARRRRDADHFDDGCDHLLVLDHSRGVDADTVVGTYRLIRRDVAAHLGGFTRRTNSTFLPSWSILGRSSSWAARASTRRTDNERRCSCYGAVSRPMYFTTISP